MTTTFEERIEARGIVVFDDALPQDFFDRALRVTGFSPRTHIVWSYDMPYHIFGQPVAVDAIGDLMLLRLDIETLVDGPDKVRLSNRLGSAMFELMGVNGDSR